jgi:DNA-binding HxlR family transcriptional regulator
MKAPTPVNDRCSIARSLATLGEKWSLLIVRDVHRGVTRFADLRTRLGVAPDVLADRLGKLVELGVLERRAYREAGSREREEYLLTASGVDLLPVLAALTAWGDEYVPSGHGPATRYVRAGTDAPVRLAFVDADGAIVAQDDVAVVRGPGAVPMPVA